MRNKEIIMTPDNFKKYVGVSITTNHTGKMSGMQSLSTSCLVNPYCEVYSKNPNMICSKCYAQTQMKLYKQMSPCYEKNAEVLCNRILKKEELPLLNASFFRFESFGDLINETQVINYFNICKANKHTKFALWTKNPFVIEKAVQEGYTKPQNLQIVLSSKFINKPDEIKYDFIDKVFTVYDKECIEKEGVEINCGARSCLKCQECYKKNKVVEIREKLK